MGKFADVPYYLLKNYFNLVKPVGYTGSSSSVLIGPRTTILARAFWTHLWVKTEIDPDDSTIYPGFTEHKFSPFLSPQDNPDNYINENYFRFDHGGMAATHTYAQSTWPEGTEVYFRKDSPFHEWLKDLTGYIGYNEYQVDSEKMFIYFGKIYPISGTDKYHIVYDGLKDWVMRAIPENNRDTYFIEFLDMYFDRVFFQCYNMQKNTFLLLDPKEVNENFLYYIAKTYSIDIDEDLPELRLREWVENLIYWLKRKGTYTSLYIVWKALLGNTINRLNIYERWHDETYTGTLQASAWYDVMWHGHYDLEYAYPPSACLPDSEWETIAVQLPTEEFLSSFVVSGGTFYLCGSGTAKLYRYEELNQGLVEMASSPEDGFFQIQYGYPYYSTIFKYDGGIWGDDFLNGRLLEWDGIDSWIIRADSIYSGDYYWGLVPLRTGKIVIYNDEVYAFSSLSGKLLKFDGVDSWEIIANQHEEYDEASSMIEFNGEIYAQINRSGYSAESGELFKWNIDDGWVKVADKYQTETNLNKMIIFNNKLYAVTQPSGKLLEFDGISSWTEVATLEDYGLIWDYNGTEYKEIALNMFIYDSKLYISTQNGSGGGIHFRLMVWNEVDAFDVVDESLSPHIINPSDPEVIVGACGVDGWPYQAEGGFGDTIFAGLSNISDYRISFYKWLEHDYPTSDSSAEFYKKTSPYGYPVWDDYSWSFEDICDLAPVNYILSPHYRVELDLSYEPLGGSSYIIDETTINNLITNWETMRPVSRFSHYNYLISGEADTSGFYTNIYGINANGSFSTKYVSGAGDTFSEATTGAKITHTQRTYAQTWTINHTFENRKNFIVQCYNWDNIKIYPRDIRLTSTQIIIEFDQQVRGYAYCLPADFSDSYSTSGGNINWEVLHGLAQKEQIVQFRNDSTEMMIPALIELTDTNMISTSFALSGTPASGSSVVLTPDYIYTKSVAASEWIINHGTDTTGIIAQFFNTDDEMIEPDIIEITNYNTITANFGKSINGYALLNFFSYGYTNTMVNLGASGMWAVGTSGGPAYDAISTQKLQTPLVSGTDITYYEDNLYWYYDFDVKTNTDDSITEVGLFDKNERLLFYTYCSTVYKPKEVDFRFHYRIEK